MNFIAEGMAGNDAALNTTLSVDFFKICFRGVRSSRAENDFLARFSPRESVACCSHSKT